MNQNLQSFARPLLTDQVLAHLSDLVAQGTWPPGQPLPSEHELSSLLGVSRPVVRECVRVLASRGMLVTLRGKGTFACPPAAWNIAEPLRYVVRADTAQLLNWSEVRAALEAAAARLAALRRKTSDLTEIDRCFARITAAKTPEEYLEADIAFHMAIATASHNPQFGRLLGPLLRPLREQLSASAAKGRFRELATREHFRIAAAVRSQDAAGAAELAAAHIMRVRAEIYDLAASDTDTGALRSASDTFRRATKPRKAPVDEEPGARSKP